MFYQDGLDQDLRFGDIVRGYILTNAMLEKPIGDAKHSDFTVSISIPQFSVIMTPCCSIERRERSAIILTPLIPVNPRFFDNLYLAEDLTRVNHIMSLQQSVTSNVLEQMGPEEKKRRLAEGITYAFIDQFIYKDHESLPEYTVHRKEGEDIATQYYMISFKNLYKVQCNKTISQKESPIESKYLQLSIETREALRTKLAFYYSRPPPEDQL